MRTSINFRETIPPSTLLKSGQNHVQIPQELIYSIKDDSRQPLNSYVILPNGQITQKSYEQKKKIKGILVFGFFFGYLLVILVLHMVETLLAHTIYLGGHVWLCLE